MDNEILTCVNCKAVQEQGLIYQCDSCGGILYDAAGRNVLQQSQFPVLLGEGQTPLVSMKESGSTLGIDEFYVKCEFMNPTGSFKDRGMATAMIKGMELGVKKVIVASAGNASASAAAYGARAGLPITAIVPEFTSPEKVRQAEEYGAKVVRIKGNYSDSFHAAKQVAGDREWYNVTTTYINPYLWSGYQSICDELIEQKGDIDWIMVPIGAGPLLGALYHGFLNLRAKGCIKRLPRLAGVQSVCCYPIAQAFFQNTKTVEEWDMTENTIASGLNDELKGYTRDGEYTLSCIYHSNGQAVIVTDEEILAARSIMGREGLYVEPAAAAGAAAAKILAETGKIRAGEVVVSIATGSGLKSSIPSKKHPLVLAESIKELLTVI